MSFGPQSAMTRPMRASPGMGAMGNNWMQNLMPLLQAMQQQRMRPQGANRFMPGAGGLFNNPQQPPMQPPQMPQMPAPSLFQPVAQAPRVPFAPYTPPAAPAPAATPGTANILPGTLGPWHAGGNSFYGGDGF